MTGPTVLQVRIRPDADGTQSPTNAALCPMRGVEPSACDKTARLALPLWAPKAVAHDRVHWG